MRKWKITKKDYNPKSIDNLLRFNSDVVEAKSFFFKDIYYKNGWISYMRELEWE